MVLVEILQSSSGSARCPLKPQLPLLLHNQEAQQVALGPRWMLFLKAVLRWFIHVHSVFMVLLQCGGGTLLQVAEQLSSGKFGQIKVMHILPDGQLLEHQERSLQALDGLFVGAEWFGQKRPSH